MKSSCGYLYTVCLSNNHVEQIIGSSHTYYDETLTQGLWNKFVTNNTSHVYYSWRLGNYGTLQVTGSHGSSSQFDGEDVYYNYMNFRAINGVDFAHTVDSGGKPWGPGTFDLWDNTSMTNVTLTSQGIIAGENVKLENITYQPMDWYGGWVTLAGAGASLNNLTAPKDYEEVVLAAGVSGGSISAAPPPRVRRRFGGSPISGDISAVSWWIAGFSHGGGIREHSRQKFKKNSLKSRVYNTIVCSCVCLCFAVSAHRTGFPGNTGDLPRTAADPWQTRRILDGYHYSYIIM